MEAGKSPAARKAGFGQEPPGQGGIIAQAGRRLVIGRAVGHEVIGRGFAGVEEFGDQPLLVNGQRQGAADAGIVEGFLGGVEAEEISAQIGEGVVVGALFECVHQFVGDAGQVPNHVGLAGFVEVQRGVGGADRQKINHFGPGVGGVPVTGIFAEADFVVQPPGVQEVRAAGGQGAGPQPLPAILGNHLARHDGEGLEGAQVEEKSGRVVQLHPDGAGIQRANAHLRGVFEASVVIRLGIFQIEKLPGVFGGRLRIQHTPPRIDHVLRGDRLAGRPQQRLAQVKGINAAIGGDFPGFRQPGNGALGDGIVAGQAFKQAVDDAQVLQAGGERRVERLRVRAVDHHQAGPGFRNGARGQDKAKRERHPLAKAWKTARPFMAR